jgi:DNA-binding GntR family transcriptional regulator
MTRLAKVTRAQPLREQVVESVVEALRTGLFPQGERLTEEGVAAALGVSRTPVREALGVLAQRGVIARRSGGGYVVPSQGAKAVEDVFAVRRLLEPYAARTIVSVITDDDIAQLREALQQLRRAASTGAEEMMQANLEMRRRLFAMLDNEPLARALAQLNESVQFVGLLTLKEASVRKLVIARHERVLRALADRDADAAEKAMLAYVEGAREAAIKALERERSLAAHNDRR